MAESQVKEHNWSSGAEDFQLRFLTTLQIEMIDEAIARISRWIRWFGASTTSLNMRSSKFAGTFPRY
jgi:hypothetical protein